LKSADQPRNKPYNCWPSVFKEF